eukprot:TRINITY_DN46_c0_g1_i3.p1 TRINITY_DN46_c0_g1~~TRINITY_DN46_c0_g1_i3.p1  ORF type:complete len:131 (+),score=46.58 TRINITY_DN46_c0_g1_i3:48-440(+)
MGYGCNSKGKGWGKGWGGGNILGAVMQLLSGGKGKGKGKGQRSFIKTVHRSKKVWIGGLAEGVKGDKDLNKQLQMHMSKAGKCTYAEICDKGTGVASFQKEEEAASAIAMLNGSNFNGRMLQIDAWTKKE